MNPEDHPLIQAYLDVVTSEKALAQAQERFAALSGSQAKPAPKAAPKAKRAPAKAKAAAPKETRPNNERVLQALGDYPDGAKVAKLADDTGLAPTAVSSALQALGKREPTPIRAISRGVYALATPAEPTNGIAHAEMT